MKKHLTFYALVLVCMVLMVTILGMVIPIPSHGQTLSDITGDVNQFGVMNPGIMCKTRTNNEATVRNLAHGVKNNSSNIPVALNCGFPAPYPMVYDIFPHSARINAYIWVVFARGTSVTNATFEGSFCNIYVSDDEDSEQTPASPSSTAVALGQVRVTSPNSDLVYYDYVSTTGISFPAYYNFFSAFCRLPKGVRLQTIEADPRSVGTF